MWYEVIIYNAYRRYGLTEITHLIVFCIVTQALAAISCLLMRDPFAKVLIAENLYLNKSK